MRNTTWVAVINTATLSETSGSESGHSGSAVRRSCSDRGRIRTVKQAEYERNWDNRLNMFLTSFAVTLALWCSGSTFDWQSEGVGSNPSKCNILFKGGCWNDEGNEGQTPSGSHYWNYGHHSIVCATSMVHYNWHEWQACIHVLIY